MRTNNIDLLSYHNNNSARNVLGIVKISMTSKLVGAVNSAPSTAHNPFHAVACSRDFSAPASNNGLFHFLQLVTSNQDYIRKYWLNTASQTFVNLICIYTLLSTERDLDRISQTTIQENKTRFACNPDFRKYYTNKPGKTLWNFKNKTCSCAAVAVPTFILPLLWMIKQGNAKGQMRSTKNGKAVAVHAMTSPGRQQA